MKVAYKIWLDNNGKAFGEGPYQLLERIEKTGSIHQAAMEMKMSYRKAWLTIKAMEERLGFALIDRKVGGVSGGGSRITDRGHALMKRYGEFRGESRKVLEEVYEKYFGQGLP